MKFDCKEDIIQLTPLWQGERYENGRPKVADSILRRLEAITTEEAWGVLWEHDYKYQFEANMKQVQPGKIMVGRAVTGVMVPKRPDLNDYLLEYGQKVEGRHGFFNSWVIQVLQEDDILVIDLFDKIFEGTYVGGNLSTAVSARTKRGGSVIWGGVRDLQQIMGITNIQTFYRGYDPTGIKDVTLIGMNVPCRIGNAICMPGDVVLGTPAGILFIPPHLAEECCTKAEKTNLRDRFGLGRVREGVYTTAEIDSMWTAAIWNDFNTWRKDNTPPEYGGLDWSGEEEEMRKRQGDNPTVA